MGRIRVGPQAIREYLGRMRERYAHAARPTKGQLLDEVCEVTGYHRKAVIRSLRRPEPYRAMLSVTGRPIVAPQLGLPIREDGDGENPSGTTSNSRVSGTDAGTLRARGAADEGPAVG